MGDNVQTGINSMINVGTLIGNDVFIGPGAVADDEIKTGESDVRVFILFFQIWICSIL